MKDWRTIGINAGKTEGWMNLEETLAETLEDHPEFARDPAELVQTDIDGWEETDHVRLIYGADMGIDARSEETQEFDADVYSDSKEAFWEGYLVGRRSIGRDIHKLARKLIGKKSKPKSVKRIPRPKSKSRSRGGDTGLRGLR